MRKKFMLFILLSVFSFSITSCNKSNVEGIYYYVEQNDSANKDINTIGKSLGCSMVKSIKLENGYYYNGLTENNMRFKYNIEVNKIIVENQGTQLVFNIIDNNTIEFFGCLFRKENK